VGRGRGRRIGGESSDGPDRFNPRQQPHDNHLFICFDQKLAREAHSGRGGEAAAEGLVGEALAEFDVKIGSPASFAAALAMRLLFQHAS